VSGVTSRKINLKIEVKNNNFDFALRKFKRKISSDGKLQEYRERRHYTKPTKQRRLAKMAGKLRWRRKERELDPVRFGKKRMY